MNKKIRDFFENLISLVNEDAEIPIEMKRLMLFIVLQMVEKKADEAVLTEEIGNAESISEDKLGELSE